MSKEIILSRNISFGSESDKYEAALKSMEEYASIKAREVAISFKEWQDSNLEDKRWEMYDGHDRWINPNTRQVISTAELFELFLQSKK